LSILIVAGATDPWTAPTAHGVELTDEILAEIDSLCVSYQGGAALVLIEPLVPLARAEGDSSRLLRLISRQGELFTSFGRSQEAEPILREAVRMSEVLVDSTAFCSALRWLGVAVATQGRRSEAVELFERLLRTAVARGDSHHEAWALVGLAWQDVNAGQAERAARRYRRAADLFSSLDNTRGEAWALNGLGMAQSALAEYEAALASYRRSAHLARQVNFSMTESFAVNNLGTLEFQLGDPGAAAEHFHRAYEIQREIGNAREMITPALNIAICETYLGRHTKASQGLRELLAECERQGYLDLQASVLNQLAKVQILEGRDHVAAALYSQALDLGEVASRNNRVEAVVGLSSVLAGMDSSAAAIAILEDAERNMAGALSGANQVLLELRMGECLLDVGRTEDALARYRVAADNARRFRHDHEQTGALVGAARAWRRLDRPDSALACLSMATEIWESARAMPLDPEWREQRSALGQRLYGDLAALMLEHPPHVSEPRRLRDAFNTLQRFKARTLLERMLGPAGDLNWAEQTGMSEPVTLVGLQRDVLHPGELLLDAYLGAEESFLFAVTRDVARAVRLPARRELGEKIRLYHELLSTHSSRRPTADPIVLRQVGSSIARLLLDDIVDLLESSDTILFVPDGPLNLLPFSELPLAIHRPDVPGEIIDSKQWMRVPSATILSWQRRQARDENGDGALRVLAMAARETSDGDPLPGAVHEVRGLARRYSRVDSRVVTREDTTRIEGDILIPYDVIHLAAHARTDDQAPWNSSIRLGPGPQSESLRAGQIATMDLSARLAVLSSCESAGGRILSGTGVQGISSAFMSAGVPAVVATLWSVDDRVTATLMARFYSELSAGNTAAAALREAQLALKRNPETRHPFYWAGFILVGEGNVRVNLKKRWEPMPVVRGGLAVALAIAVITGGCISYRGRSNRL